MPDRSVVVRPYLDLVSPQAGDEWVTGSVGPAGEILGLWCATADLAAATPRRTVPGGSSFADTEPSRSMSARVTVQRPGAEAVTVRIDRLPVAFPAVQPLPGGRLLLVGARCEWRRDGPERNAVVYAADGGVQREATVGDGVQDVLTTAAGDVWVSYFDEGVFGNLGWGDPGAPAPIGAPGLNRFSARLDLAWSFPYDGPADPIDDCYALNVADDAVWACYFSSFPVVRVRGGDVTSWAGGVGGAQALAVHGNRVALVYQERGRLTVGELDGDRLRVTGRHRLTRPDGRPFPASPTVSRGSRVYLRTDERWWYVDLRDVPD